MDSGGSREGPWKRRDMSQQEPRLEVEVEPEVFEGQMWGAWARRVGDEAGELGRLWYKKDLVGFTQKFRCDPVGSGEPLKGEQQNRVI